MALRFLDLTVLRETAVSKPPTDEVNFDERIHRLEKYLKLLHNFSDKADLLMDQNAQAQLGFDWVVPQFSSPSFHSLHGVKLELAMALVLYAAALRQKADLISLQTCESAAEEAADFAAAAQLFQKAAGVLEYIDENLLDSSSGGGKLKKMLPQLVRGMAKLSLGEAQAVIASRAEARKSPPTLVAALHCAASEERARIKKRYLDIRKHAFSRADLFESGASELQPNPSSVASQRFRMLLALSSQLHQIRARISIAGQQSKDGHPGAACADLLDAGKRISDAAVAVETDLRWKAIFAEERQVVSKHMALYEQERQVVSIERIAPQRSRAPEPKLLARPIPYSPEKMTVEVF